MEENDQNKPQATIEVQDTGPLKITGNIVIQDIKRNTSETLKEVWLCRCGKSSNKPFCDESHKRE
jgi:CDGSH-type Zn-finger protein